LLCKTIVNLRSSVRLFTINSQIPLVYARIGQLTHSCRVCAPCTNKGINQSLFRRQEIRVIQELLLRADQRGYVTFEDVLEVLDEDGDDVNAIEALLYELDELGIELRQESEAPDRLMMVDDLDMEFEPEEILQDPGVGDINAVSADDPVGLYFRQMAQEPLLTAQEEIELAKRIELGKQARETLRQMRENPELYNEALALHADR